MEKKHESDVISYSDSDSVSARQEIFKIMQNYPSTESELERSLGLFLRGSLLARIFAIRELYELIVDIPGMIFDLGTWRGQTAVVCENMRAIFEPLHFNRRIASFDTFEGYSGFSEKDKPTALHKDGTYDVGKNYTELLAKLLTLHERSNAMGHNNGKHFVIAGDCRITVPAFFEKRPQEVVALAFFDLNSFDPTQVCFSQIFEKLVPGGVVAFWQLTRDAVPAEGMVYSETILNKLKHTLHKSKYYPGLCYIKKI